MSVIFADPVELHAIADRISRHADAVRSNASMLAAAIATDRWRGLAAQVFSAQAGSVRKDMWACAGRLDDAADALRRHARRVQGALDFLKLGVAGVEGWGATIAHEVGGFLVGAEGLLEDALTRIWG
jgi:uncharacterized protein YukE